MVETVRMQDSFPAGLAPITKDGGGDRVCLDCRDPARTRVVYWSHEGETGVDDIYFLAETFTAFLQMLQTDDS